MKLFASLGLLTSAQALQTWFDWDCPTSYTSQSSFDKSRYLGRWYEIYRDQYTGFEWLGECGTATYTARDDGDIDIANRGWFPWWFFTYYTAEGQARPSSEGKAELYVTFAWIKDMTQPTNYKILETDYDNYSIIYQCG